MPIDKNTEKSKGFSFLKAPQHVSDELIKRNGFEFQKQSIGIENARTSRKKRRYNRFSINQQNARPNSVIKIDSSNQHLSNRKVIRGAKMYAETMPSSMTLSNLAFNESVFPTSNKVIFGDSLVNFIIQIKYNINRSLNNRNTRFEDFPGVTSKNLLHYVDTTFQDNSFEVAVIYVGINNIADFKNSLQTYTDHMLQNIKSITQKSERYDIQKVLISGLLTTNSLAQDFLEEVNKSI